MNEYVFSFQVAPVLLTQSLLERLRNNFMIIEVWDKKTSSENDHVRFMQYFIRNLGLQISQTLIKVSEDTKVGHRIYLKGLPGQFTNFKINEWLHLTELSCTTPMKTAPYLNWLHLTQMTANNLTRPNYVCKDCCKFQTKITIQENNSI